MEEIMNAAPLVEITPEIAKTLKRGTLIGFKGHAGSGKNKNRKKSNI